jgi:hypothetical protein
MGNYVSGVCVSAEYDDSKDFWINAKALGNVLNKKLRNTKDRMIGLSLVDALDDTLIDAINFAGFGGYNNTAAQKLCGIVCGEPADEGLGISNLGKLNMYFDNFSIDEMWFVPPLFAADDFITGVFTVNGILRFCLRYSASEINEDFVSALFAEAKSLLLSGIR